MVHQVKAKKVLACLFKSCAIFISSLEDIVLSCVESSMKNLLPLKYGNYILIWYLNLNSLEFRGFVTSPFHIQTEFWHLTLSVIICTVS